MPGTRYNIRITGSRETARGFDEITDSVKRHRSAIDDEVSSQNQRRRAVRAVLGEYKLQRDEYLAQHQTLFRLGQAMGTFSRIMHVVTVAQQAWNIAQLLTNQTSAEAVKSANDLRQAQRAYDLALKQGKSGEELANLAEDLEYAKTKNKEFQDQMNQQKISNIINAATTFGYLATSIGSIVTKAPEMISLFRRLGGIFGAGGGGGLGSTGGITGSRPGGGGFGGSAGGITGSTPIAGGRCVSLCQDTVNRLGPALATPIADRLKEGLRSILPTLLPLAAGIGGTIGLSQVITAIEKGYLKLPFDVNVLNWPEWMHEPGVTAPLEEPIKTPVPILPSLDLSQYGGPFQTAGSSISRTIEKRINEELKIEDSAAQGAQSAEAAERQWGIAEIATISVGTAAGIIATYWDDAVSAFSQAVTRLQTGLGKIPNIESRGFEHFGSTQTAEASSGGRNLTKVQKDAFKQSGGSIGKLMARGGIVNTPTLAMIGESGPEMVVPLDSGGAGGDVNITIINQGPLVTLDQLYETFDDKYLKRELRKRMVGRS